MNSAVRDLIEEAIRHATNAQRAVHPDGGHHDARRVRELISETLTKLS